MPAERSFLKDLVADGRWKLAALVVAVIVFYAVRGTISHTSTLTVPVEVAKQPGWAVLSAEPFSVRVTVRGAFSDLQQLAARDVSLLLQPRADATEGATTVRVRARDLHGLPHGVRVVGLEPEHVTLRFDREIELPLPVADPPVEGKPLRGRVELDYAPHVVTVRGARRPLEELEAGDFHLQTEPINVEGCVQGFTKTVRVVTPGGAWQADVTPREIAVKVNIITERSTREMRDVPVSVAAVPGRRGQWQVVPSNVTVRLTGRAEMVQSVLPDAVVAWADGRRVGLEETEAVPVQVHLPPGTTVDAAEVEPPTVLLMRNAE